LPFDPVILGIYPKEPKTPVHQRSSQHYSQKPSFGNNPGALQLMNGSWNCGTYTQWSFT
jgi:hypothetical protein